MRKISLFSFALNNHVSQLDRGGARGFFFNGVGSDIIISPESHSSLSTLDNQQVKSKSPLH